MRSNVFLQYEAACRYLSTPSSPDSTIHGQSDPHLSWSNLLLAGAIAGIGEVKSACGLGPYTYYNPSVRFLAGWVATFPLDVVKTRMQGTQATEIQSPVAVGSYHLSTTPLLQAGRTSPQELNPFRTIWSTIVYSYRTEGLGVFFRGLSPTLIRCVCAILVSCKDLHSSSAEMGLFLFQSTLTGVKLISIAERFPSIWSPLAHSKAW